MNEKIITSNDSDIEKEEGNEDIKIEIPFNPNEINIKIIPFTVGQLIDKLEYNEVRIPEYQRLPNLWNTRRKSRFIESLILRLPIPLFYFDEREKDIWWVVDGLQRTTAIKEFAIEKKFKLENLEFLNSCNDLGWDDLSREIKRNINQSQITINLIQKGTPEEVKHNIFRRINQGAIELSNQELRTALFWGEKIDFIKEFVSTNSETGKSFHKATDNKIKDKRQEDLDFISRFIAFYLLEKLEEYEPDMDTFITKGMKKIPKEIERRDQIAMNFKKSMDLAFKVFNNDAFRKRKSLNESRKPINKPLFEVISVAFAKLNETQSEVLIANKDKFIQKLINLQKTDNSFWSAITNGTATKDNVKIRHSKFNDLVNNYLNDK